MINSLCEILGVKSNQLNAQLERIESWVEGKIKMYESKDGYEKMQVKGMKQLAGYRNSRTGEFGLNEKATEALKNEGLNEYLVKSYLEAKYSVESKDYNIVKANQGVF